MVITNPDEQLLIKEITAFAFKSPKKRHGFDVDDCIFHLAMEKIRADASVVKLALSMMVNQGILEQSYSLERGKTIYRLR